MAAPAEMVLHVDLQRAEAAAEVDLLFGRDALVAEHQHLMVRQRRPDGLEPDIGQRLAEIDPGISAPRTSGSGRMVEVIETSLEIVL